MRHTCFTMRRRVCEARKEMSGCEVFDGSQEGPEVCDRSGSLVCSLIVGARCRSQTATCTGHCATLFHWVAVASRRARESDRLFCIGTNGCKNAYFPFDGARLLLSSTPRGRYGVQATESHDENNFGFPSCNISTVGVPPVSLSEAWYNCVESLLSEISYRTS